MVSDNYYWKDKTVDGKQIVSGWIVVCLLALGAYYAQAVTWTGTCDTGKASRTASASDNGDSVSLRARDLR
jgi:hypothetical protein